MFGKPRQVLQRLHVFLGEGVGTVRKSFEDANDPSIVMQRNGGNRGDLQMQANRWVSAEIFLRVIATQCSSGAKALAGNARVHTQTHPEVWGALAACPDANDDAFPAHRECGCS